MKSHLLVAFVFGFCSAFSLISSAAQAQNREVLFPGESIRIGDTTVECRSQGGGGNQCPTEGLDAAKALCNDFPTWAGTDACLASLRNARYAEVGAVSVCRAYATWAGTQDCLNAIQDRMYTSSEVSGCNSRPSWASTTTCFQNSGRPVSCW